MEVLCKQVLPRLDWRLLQLDGDDKIPVRLQHVHHHPLLVVRAQGTVQTPVTDRRELGRPASLGDVVGRPDVWHEDSRCARVRRLLYAAAIGRAADAHEDWCRVPVADRRLHRERLELRQRRVDRVNDEPIEAGGAHRVGDERRGALQHDADRWLGFELRPKGTIADHRSPARCPVPLITKSCP